MEQTTITRADRKIELAKLSVNRHALIEAFAHATSVPTPAEASNWDLIRGILDVEFPPPPRRIDGRGTRRLISGLATRHSMTAPNGSQ